MPRYITRRAWGAAARRQGPGRLDAGTVVGIALHWPASGSTRYGTVDAVSRALRGWQRFHQVDRGWSDIAYQEAVDQAGNVYELRGLRNVSAANGGTTVNRTHGALLLVLGAGEQPTPAMVEAVRRRIARHRELFPGSRQIVGHGAIRPGGSTECPGPIVRELLERGAFTPRPAPAPNRVQRARLLVADALELLNEVSPQRVAVAGWAEQLRAGLKRAPQA